MTKPRLDLMDSERVYRPTLWQEIFHRARTKGRVSYGANQSGKSRMGCNEDLWWVLTDKQGYYRHPWQQVPIPCYVWVINQDFTQSRSVFTGHGGDTGFTEFTKWIRNFGKKPVRRENKQEHYWVLRTGSVLEFKSSESSDTKFGAAKLHYAHFDEVPDEPVFKETMVRLLSYGGRWSMTATAVRGVACWTHDDFWMQRGVPLLSYRDIAPHLNMDRDFANKLSVYINENKGLLNKVGNPLCYHAEDRDILLINPSIYDNYDQVTGELNIQEKEIKYLERTLSKTERTIRIQGWPAMHEGLVFGDFWEPERHMVPPFTVPSHWLRCRGIDYGFTKEHPMVIVWLALSPEGSWYVYDEYTGVKMSARQCGTDAMQRHELAYGEEDIWEDIDDSRGADRRIEMEDVGYYPKPTQASPRARYEKIAELLATDRLFVMEGRAPRFCEEMTKFAYPDQSKRQTPTDEPKKLWNDSIDAAGGVVTSNQEPPDALPVERRLTAEDAFEESLQRYRKQAMQDAIAESKEREENIWNTEHSYY